MLWEWAWSAVDGKNLMLPFSHCWLSPCPSPLLFPCSYSSVGIDVCTVHLSSPAGSFSCPEWSRTSYRLRVQPPTGVNLSLMSLQTSNAVLHSSWDVFARAPCFFSSSTYDQLSRSNFVRLFDWLGWDQRNAAWYGWWIPNRSRNM